MTMEARSDQPAVVRLHGGHLRPRLHQRQHILTEAAPHDLGLRPASPRPQRIGMAHCHQFALADDGHW